MEACENRKWLIKLNKISWNVLMPVMAVTFILFNTVINQWIGERIETLQNLLVIFIMLIFACNIFADPKKNIPAWIRVNWLVIIYFAVRAMTLIKMDFEYSTIRTIFFEVFFLIGITECTVGGSDKRNLYIKIFVWMELVLTAVSLLLYYMLPYLGSGINGFAESMMFLEKCGNAMVFSNPNTAGLMAGFSIVLAIVCFGKNIFNNKFIIFYGLYNVAALILFGCRSSDIGVIAAVAVLVLMKLIPKINGRAVAAAILIMMVLSVAPIYGFIKSQGNMAYDAFTETELAIDYYSSGRYVVWKGCYIAQQDDLMLGNGSLKMEQADRAELIKDMDPDYYWRQARSVELGPHNGYIAMIAAAGVLGLLLFVAIILQRIWCSKSLKKDSWCLLLVFIFVVNMFESLFIVNRFFTCFYMLLLLTIDFNDDGSTDAPSLEETE